VGKTLNKCRWPGWSTRWGPPYPKKSLEWMKKGAAAGDTRLMVTLAKIYEQGVREARSIGAATELIEKAARGGNPEAMVMYADRLTDTAGRYVLDPATFKSLRKERGDWLLKAASSGYVNAMRSVADSYEVGLISADGKPDYKKAFGWTNRAKNSGLSLDLARLSRLSRFGIGCDQDEAKAESLLERAKELARFTHELRTAHCG
jgi:uncharacterized protein